MTRKEYRFLERIGIHYKAYYKDFEEVGVKFKQQYGPILEVSAGTNEHVLTTGVSTPSLCEFIKEKFNL